MKAVYIFFVCLLLAGCETSTYLFYNFRSGAMMSASVGAQMCTWTAAQENWDRGVYGYDEEALLYYGKEGTVIKIAYREQSNGHMVPGSNIDLTYNIAKDSTIAFRSTRIRIVTADNETIEFMVLDSPSFIHPSGYELPRPKTN